MFGWSLRYHELHLWSVACWCEPPGPPGLLALRVSCGLIVQWGCGPRVASLVACYGLCPGLVCCLVWPVSNELVLIVMPVHTLALIGVFEITTSRSAHVDQR